MKTKNNFIKFIAVLLFAALFLSLLVSCQTGGANDDGDSKNDNDAASNQNQEDIQNTEEQEATTERVYPELDAKDFGGYEFTFLGRTINAPDWAEWDHRDLIAEEQNGDVINDAVYQRNTKIEEKYNIVITQKIELDASSKLTRSVKSGDDTYDVFCPHITEVAAMAQGGNFIDLFNAPNIDLSKPWWTQGCIRDLSIINKLFVIQGDLLIMDNDAMEAMIFNKAVLQDYALESPYDIVKRGEWTFEKLIEMGRGVAKDLNGDGEMYIKDDLFGYILQGDTAASFIVSGGEKIVSKDENDYPVITFGSERCYKITEFLSEMLSDTDNSVNLHSYENKFPIYDEQVKMFSENRALFSWIRMRIVERLRGMEMDFGIIPLPKLDKFQEKYITPNNPHTGAGISIPITAGDLERTGMILEDLSAESKYTLQPAYYEINLQGKLIRDDESQEMLDIILSNIAYDIGYIYNFGGFGAATCERYGRDMKVEWASQFAKLEVKMEAAIEKMTTAYEKLGE
ncbi:MAG: hypothetical protein FWF92_01590 [Oscillospiraceae bacterium]|nr:hypothetical protein [Oscillospiraceae bacterium]